MILFYVAWLLWLLPIAALFWIVEQAIGLFRRERR